MKTLSRKLFTHHIISKVVELRHQIVVLLQFFRFVPKNFFHEEMGPIFVL